MEPFLKCGLTFATLQLPGNELSLIERLQSWDIGFAKISAPTFRNLPDKLSMPTALDGFKPIDGLDGFKYLIFFQEIFQKIQNLIH